MGNDTLKAYFCDLRLSMLFICLKRIRADTLSVACYMEKKTTVLQKLDTEQEPKRRPFLHTIDFYQRHDYQGIIKSNVKLNFFVPLHQHVSLLFFHHSAYHSEWLSWPCLCNFFTIISITYAEIVTSKNQLRHPKFYCITRNSKCNLYLFDLFVQHNCN